MRPIYNGPSLSQCARGTLRSTDVLLRPADVNFNALGVE